MDQIKNIEFRFLACLKNFKWKKHFAPQKELWKTYLVHGDFHILADSKKEK